MGRKHLLHGAMRLLRHRAAASVGTGYFRTAVGSADDPELLRPIAVCLGVDVFWKQHFTGTAVFLEHAGEICLIPLELVCPVQTFSFHLVEGSPGASAPVHGEALPVGSH